MIEQVERLATQYGWDIHAYSQRVEGVSALTLPSNSDSSPGAGRIIWHKVSQILGPHLLKFIWWFLANRIRRMRDRSSENLRADVTYSPGINCLDADAVIVHMVFYEFYARVRSELRLRSLPLRIWPVILHRKLYYHLIMFLERRVYSNSKVRLAAVSQLVASQLGTYFGRADVTIIPSAVDTSVFSCSSRLARRPRSRALLNFSDEDFVLLLIGNDWRVKGLDHLLSSVEVNPNLPFRLLVVGRDEPFLYANRLRQSRIESRVTFQQPSSDVIAVLRRCRRLCRSISSGFFRLARSRSNGLRPSRNGLQPFRSGAMASAHSQTASLQIRSVGNFRLHLHPCEARPDPEGDGLFYS
jgi:hypothetical protein